MGRCILWSKRKQMRKWKSNGKSQGLLKQQTSVSFCSFGITWSRTNEGCTWRHGNNAHLWHVTKSIVGDLTVSIVWRCELIPYSQRAHLNYLTVGSYRGYSVRSQWTHKMISSCALAVSFLWVCNSYSELTATTAWWAHSVISKPLTASSRCELQTHGKLPASSQSESTSKFTVR